MAYRHVCMSDAASFEHAEILCERVACERVVCSYTQSQLYTVTHIVLEHISHLL